MSKDKKIVTQLEVQAIIDKAQKDFASLSKEVDSMWQKSHPPKTVSKQLADLELRLASLQKMAEKTEIFPSDMSQITGDAKAFTKEVHNLTLSFKLLTDEQKKAMLGKDIADSLDKRRKALKDYDDIVKKNALNQEEWNKLQNQKTQKEDGIKQARQELEAKEQLLSRQQKIIQYAESYSKKLQKIQNLTNSIAAAEEELKGIDQEKAPKTYQKKQGQISRLKEDRAQTQKDLDEDKRGEKAFKVTGKDEKIKQTQKDIETLKETIKQSETSIKDFSKQMEDLIPVSTQEALKDLVQALKLLGVSVDNEGETIESLTDKVETLEQEAIKPISEACQKAQNNLTELGEGAKQVGDKVDECTEDLKKQEEVLKNEEAFNAKIKQFLGMAGAVEILKRSLRNAFETTKQLDKAMTEMAVVTDLQVGDYWEQLPEHTKRASELGVAIKEVYEAETLYYQQGLKTESAQALANETLKMARIAGLDAAEATDKMTAALRGFNMELNEASAQKVSDVYSELAAITAADVNEISSAMTKTASIASSAGMEFETTAAFLSQIIETTRESAETAGTAMKTVIARFQELKKSPGEIGEIDGEIVDANAIETALRSVGVSLRDSTGQFRELDDVFLELSSKWDSLDKNTQRYIATIAAGSRQQSRFIAMMSDYGRTQELVTAANNSAGASQRQYEKTLESLETKLARLKAAWDEFSMGILESDLVKFGVDVLTKFLEIINKATSAFDGLGGTIMKVLSTIALFKVGQKIFDKMKQPMYNFFAEIINKARETGEKAGDAAKEGLEKSKKKGNTKEAKVPSFESLTSEKSSKDKKTIKEQAISLKANAVSFITGGEEGAKHREQASIAKAAAEAAVNKGKAAKANIGTISSKITDTDTQIAEKKKAIEDQKTKISEAEGKLEKAPKKGTKRKKAQNNYNAEKQKAIELEKELQTLEEGRGNLEGELAAEQEKYNQSEADYNEHSQKFAKESQASWDAVGENISKAGAAVTGLGVGISMLGGLLSSLGLEEAGEVVTNIGNGIAIVGGLISFVGTALTAIPPILTVITAHPIIAIITAICLLLITTIALVAAAAKKNSIDARMKAAAEATEKAKEAAEGAKQAYDSMVEDRKGFDEMQKKLEGLTKGTQEWKEALRESNAQVLDLIQTYPELAKYVTKGEQGQLTIDDAGWDELIANQEKAVANAQAAVAYRQMNELDLQEEKAKQGFVADSTVIRGYDNKGQPIIDTNATKGLQEDLEQIYLVAGSSLDEMQGKADELAAKYGITTNQVWEAAKALSASSDELNNISDQSEAIARANLTAMASQDLLDSKFGDQAVDAFANSLNNDKMDAEVERRVSESMAKDGSGGIKGEEEFNKVAKAYGVENEMTGNDDHDARALYEAVIGTKAGDGMSVEEMLKAIYAADETNKLAQQMESYANKLASIEDSSKAQNIAGLLSDEGKGMTGSFAKELFKNDQKTFDRSKVDEIANQYFGGIDAWAEMVGKTTEELYEEIEKNARDAVVINEATFGRFERVLGKANRELGKGTENLEKFGENAQISTENSVNLIDKIIGASQITGDKGALEIKEQLDSIFEAAGDNADIVAGVIGTMNWNSAEDWQKLPEVIDSMNLAFDGGTEAEEAFIKQLKELAENANITSLAIKTVDLKKIASDIQNMFNTIKSLQSGEQGRIFSQDIYDKLVASDPSKKDQFVQIGEEFHYIGSSMNDLTNALVDSTKETLALAQVQREQNLKVADAMQTFDSAGGALYGGKRLKATEGGSTEWSRDEQIAYLEALRANGGMETLQFLTGDDGESLGLTLGTNFQELSAEQLDAVMKALEKNFADAPEIREALAKTIADAEVAGRMANDYEKNLEESKTGKTQETRDAAAKAFGIQAAQSGQVADEVIGRYNELIAGAKEEEEGELNKLREVMSKGLERANKNLEAQKTIDETTNRVAEALYNIGQAEIDKLSQLNDSVNEANEKLLSKIQEQIDDERQAREMERAQQDIADKEARLAYLMRDTSGANAVEIQQLQKELEQDKESYGDSLVDESLQKLQDANEAAAEQRERQIELMQAQLDYSKESGALMLEAENIVAESTADLLAGKDPMSTKMATVFKEEASIGTTLTAAETAALDAQIGDTLTKTANATSALTGKAQGSGTGGIQEAVDLIKDEVSKKEEAETDEMKYQAARAEAVKAGVKAVSGSAGGWSNLENNDQYEQAKQDFVAAYGDATQFDELVKKGASKQVVGSDGKKSVQYISGTGEITSGVFDSSMAQVTSGWGDYNGQWDDDIKIKIGDTEITGLSVSGIDKNPNTTSGEKGAAWLERADSATASAINKMFEGAGVGVDEKAMALYYGEPYIYRNNSWRRFNNNSTNGRGVARDKLATAMKNYLNAYETGGLADFTGPAWLDGTKSHPELVLNARDTENFIQLKDILAEIMSNSIVNNSSTNNTSGDNYYDIDISVESLGDDYDVEQLADKIRSMIYNDSMYRNVNTVNLIR